MKNKRFINTMGVLFVTASMLFGCGNTKTEESQATTPNVEIIEENEEAIVVEVETVEETISSFAEENGMVFDIIPEEYFVLHTYNSKNEDEREEQDFDTILTGVSAFKSSDSFVSVDGYHYEQGTFIIYKNTPNNGVNFNAYIFDYYTGAVVDLKGLDVSAEMTKDQADNAFIVKVGETEYSITAYSAFEQTDIGWELTFTALVPNEYDGLCFGIGGIVLEEATESAEEKGTLLITDTTYGKIPQSWHFYHANELEVIEETSESLINNEISDNWIDGELLIDGVKIKMPCTLTELEKTGWRIEEVNYPSPDKAVCGPDFSIHNEKYEQEVRLFNNMIVTYIPTSKDWDVSDIKVTEIHLHNHYNDDTLFETSDITLPKGIGLGSTEEEIIKAYGEPSSYYEATATSDASMYYRSENPNLGISFTVCENHGVSSIYISSYEGID